MNVYLSGMIGSGKSTLGARLAARLGRPFHDLDRELERIIGRSFHDLVRDEGWLAFREVEYRVCKEFAALREAVCALGGGTVRYQWNLDALRETGVLVFLDADLATLAARVRAADRPRVNPGASLEEDLERIWRVSADCYRTTADLVYRTDTGRSVEQEVEDLAALLRVRGVPPGESRRG
ncbi:MAG TPA: shikimate kinase [Methylomirabilota bacterium]|nr:shikimate kinase [Methylomirabilota bacterium]